MMIAPELDRPGPHRLRCDYGGIRGTVPLARLHRPAGGPGRCNAGKGSATASEPGPGSDSESESGWPPPAGRASLRIAAATGTVCRTGPGGPGHWSRSRSAAAAEAAGGGPGSCRGHSRRDSAESWMTCKASGIMILAGTTSERLPHGCPFGVPPQKSLWYIPVIIPP
jgi:hypothetical protein